LKFPGHPVRTGHARLGFPAMQYHFYAPARITFRSTVTYYGDILFKKDGKRYE
jgi:hypothetical protein